MPSSVALRSFTLLYNSHHPPSPKFFLPQLKLCPPSTLSPTSLSHPYPHPALTWHLPLTFLTLWFDYSKLSHASGIK